jgi:hypothetical protein
VRRLAGKLRGPRCRNAWIDDKPSLQGSEDDIDGTPDLEMEHSTSTVTESLAESVDANHLATLTSFATESGTTFESPHRLQMTLKPSKWSGTRPSHPQPQHFNSIIEGPRLGLIVVTSPHHRRDSKSIFRMRSPGRPIGMLL